MKGYCRSKQLSDFLKCDVQAILSAVPKKPGMTWHDLFRINTTIVPTLMAACDQPFPGAMIYIIVNTVNATMNLLQTFFEMHGMYKTDEIFNRATLDIIRVNTFMAELKGLYPAQVIMPVTGGHDGRKSYS